MSSSKILLYFLLSFIGGIFISSFLDIPKLIIYEIFVLGILYSLIFFKEKAILVFGISLIILTLGISYYQITDKNFNKTELKKFSDTSQIIKILGIVVKEPDIRENNTKLIIEVQNLNGIKIKSRILITIRKYSSYQYGDMLTIIGLLKTPNVFEDFNYKDYLKKDRISAVMHYPETKLISENQKNPIFTKILSFKNKLREILYQNLSPPQSSILGAILLGDKQKISSEWKEKLNIAGVRHITAVSGMHIVILSGVLMSLLIGLGLWRGQAFYFALIILWCFILMVGFQSSAIRAGIMGSIFLFCQKIGRSSTSSRAVILSAALMLLINPFLLRYDVGFQLSFLAVMGIIHLGPIFKNWLSFIPEEKFINLRSILVMTFAAQIFTLPILIYNFGRISFISPLTNILILPTIYWIMIFGFIFVLGGVIWQPMGWILSFPVLLLLNYLTSVVDLFSRFKLSSVTFQISWISLPIFYFFLAYFLWRFSKKTNRIIN